MHLQWSQTFKRQLKINSHRSSYYHWTAVTITGHTKPNKIPPQTPVTKHAAPNIPATLLYSGGTLLEKKIYYASAVEISVNQSVNKKYSLSTIHHSQRTEPSTSQRKYHRDSPINPIVMDQNWHYTIGDNIITNQVKRNKSCT